MSLSRVSLAALLLLPLTGLACAADPPAPEGEAAKQDAPEATPAEPVAKSLGKYELSAEEIDLIARDPKTLGPDQNRKRAHALRKKIMQNPDSDAAKALEEARQSALAGQIELPGQPPKEKGLVIEAPDYLRNQDQTYDRSLADDKPSE
jgi:hypothetical protein